MTKPSITCFVVMLSLHLCWCQEPSLDSLPITGKFSNMSLQEAFDLLQRDQPYQIYGLQADLSQPAPSVDFTSTPLYEVFRRLLSSTDLGHMTYRDYLVIVAPRQVLTKQFDPELYQALQQPASEPASEESVVITIGNISTLDASGMATIEGTIVDHDGGEPVIGATVSVLNTSDGTYSDDEGRFELILPPGRHSVVVQYIGYETSIVPIQLAGNGTMEIKLETSSVILDEVLVEAQAQDENVRSVQVGVTRISTKEIEKLPSFLGEVDIIKSLLLQPGVSSIGEGSGGFNVRGGNVDQNLILIDEGFLFNPSHALGFFSAFHSDIVSEALLFKGNIPANYGGRLSSVLDLKVRNGDFEKLRLKGGLGLVSTRFVLEGPLAKGKTSALLAVRSTYSDWVLKAIKNADISQSSVVFQDANVRVSHRFNDNNSISLSGYYSKDKFIYSDQFGFDYSTSMAQMHYRRVFGEHLLSTLSGIWSKYESTQLDLDGHDGSSLAIANEYYKIKENLSYHSVDFDVDLGFSGIYYRIDPGELRPRGALSTVIPSALELEEGVEMAAYLNAEWNAAPGLSFNAGLRHSWYRFLGPKEMYLYDNEAHPTTRGIIEKALFEDDVIYAANNLEPRISARYRIDAQRSVKAGYARTTQYLNQISNNETPTPTNLWQLSHQYVPPNLAHNYTLGYFQNFEDNLWITSLEIFYRDIDRLFDYRDFADLITNDHIETELLRGTGRAMGLELAIKKQTGRVNGWLNYTWSRSERKIEGINQGAYYPASFDKPHDLSLVANIQLNKRNQVAVNFNFSSGRPATVPIDRHVLEDKFASLNYSQRNGWRIPDYHRFDISYTLGQGPRKSKKFKTSWTLSIYNVYGRRNAFSVFFDQNSTGQPEVKRLAVLGSAFPSLTFNFELL